jgi:hypothetical protein
MGSSIRSGTLGLSAVAAAVVLAGCGGSSVGPNAKKFSGEQRKVAQVIDDLSSASRAGDANRICDEIFTPRFAGAVAKRNKTTCRTRVQRVLVSKQERITITQLIVQTPNATAQVQEQNGNVSRITLRKQNGGWRVDGIQ